MYDKITILADTGFIVNHLSMNGYNFEVIGQNLYALTDEVSYVEKILKDYNILYIKNDESIQLQTERGLVSVSGYVKDLNEAHDNGFTYAFTTNKGVALCSKMLDVKGYYHEFRVLGSKEM